MKLELKQNILQKRKNIFFFFEDKYNYDNVIKLDVMCGFINSCLLSLIGIFSSHLKIPFKLNAHICVYNV